MKTNLVAAPIMLALLLTPFALQAQTTISDSAEAAIRDGSNANVDISESTLGYCMVKYSTSGSAAKSYFKFDFTGQNPNTNNAITFTCTTAPSSSRQELQVWALNQSYATFNSSVLVWNTAQANELTNNYMLTNGTYTATMLLDVISVDGAAKTQTITIPAPWGSYLLGNQLVLVLTATNNYTGNTSGYRVKTNTTTLDFQTLVGAPPTISAIPDITVMATQTSATNSFTVGDPEDGPNGLSPTAVSSSEGVVSSTNVFFEGTGANRKVYVVAGTNGVANVTVSVTDGAGNLAQRTFKVTVMPLDYPPSISNPGPTNTLVNTSVTVPFTVGDTETPATSLVVTGQVASYSVNILGNLTFGGSGSNRTVTVQPVPGADGVGVVNLSVTDGNNATVITPFPVMVRSASNIVFIEHFDYAPNVKLFEYSAGLWVRRNSNPQNINLLTAPDALAGYVRPKASADDGAARLAGAPYRPGTGALLYTKFTATWVDLGAGDVLVTNSNGGFIHLANNSSASSTLFAKVATTTNNVPDGAFRLALFDLNDQYQANSSIDLYEPAPVSGPYTVVVRYDVDSARSTLWVNATTEADPSASSQDQTTPENISYIGLRQDLGFGYIYVDDLKVQLALKPTITSITQPAGGNVDIYFSGGAGDTISSFGVVRANTAGGTYGDVAATITSTGGTTFKATVAAPGSQEFYRIKRLPMTF
jgi:hypothetical protein